MTRGLALLLLLTGGLLTAGASAARAADRLQVRVVTQNARGLPLGADDQAPRLARLGAALAALTPDVVCLQEVWDEADAEALAGHLAEAGLSHWRRFPSRLWGSGLVVVSRWPIVTEAFTPFTLSGKPHRPGHGDWYAGKGLARVTIDTPLGRVLVANTHLNARHEGDEYLYHQIGQALEAADAVGDHGARPPAADFDPARPPLLLLGDVDCPLDAAPRRLLAARADLTFAAPDLGGDVVMFRPGGDVAIKVKKVAPALGGEVDLGDGRRGRLTDQAGALADLELRRLDRAPRPALHTLTARWRAAAAATAPLVEAELQACRARASAGRSRALLLALVGVALLLAGRKRKGRRQGCLLPLLALAPLHVALWSMYLGAVYERSLEQGLVKAARQLEERDR